MEENNELINNPAVEYTDDNIRHLSDMEQCAYPSRYVYWKCWVTDRHAEDGIYVSFERNYR